MKKLLLLIFFSLFWTSIVNAEKFYIICEKNNLNYKFLFKIDTFKKKMTMIRAPLNNGQETTRFDEEIISIKIKDVTALKPDPSDNSLPFIKDFTGDYTFNLNRITGELAYLHNNPKLTTQSFEILTCSKTKKKI